MIALPTVIGAFALVTVAPGPANLAMSPAAMARGPGPAQKMACGLALGLAAWGVLAAAALGAALTTSEAALTGVRLAGGAVLLRLGARSLISASRSHRPVVPVGVVRTFRTGFMLDLANATAVFAWAAALAVGLVPSSGPEFAVAATDACATIAFATYVGWALLMSRARVQALYRTARRPVDAVLGGLFGLAGAELIREGIAR